MSGPLQPSDISIPSTLIRFPSPSPSPSPPLSNSAFSPEPFSNLRDERAFEDAKHLSAKLVQTATLNPTLVTVPSTAQQIQENIDILADLDPDDTFDIDLTHLRLETLKGLGLERFVKVERVSMRQNALNELWFDEDNDAEEQGKTLNGNGKATEEQEEVETASEGEDNGATNDTTKPTKHTLIHPLSLLPALQELDLYDNRLTTSSLYSLLPQPNLTSLDVSFNNIRSLKPLEPTEDGALPFPKLEMLYVIQNKLNRIEGVKLREGLRYLELGGNRIRKIENLPNSTTLRSLFLGKNKITKIEGLDGLVSLTTLSIQSNRLTKIEGLESLTSLEELYLSHNGITDLEGLYKNTKLTTLDIGNNKITVISKEELSSLTLLEEFWANNNQINHLPVLPPSTHPNLNTIYLEGNPVEKDLGTAYRRRIMLECPQVKQIDAVFVRAS